ncbi:hypothetical protein V5J35_002703 [Endozoicomonas sp. NE40]|uniref:Transposase n=1 Tax=Endozoicomonas lisbonensis TaxID=3120522 RepID=A0ABV2SIB3_9GAMM
MRTDNAGFISIALKLIARQIQIFEGSQYFCGLQYFDGLQCKRAVL